MPKTTDKASYSTFQAGMEQAVESNDVQQEQPPFNFIQDSKTVLKSGPLNIFLILIPPTVYFYLYTNYDLLTFVLSLLALSALAERLGYVTEQLALYTNETIGGLLNATFGNATELIISLSALFKGLYRLIQLSLLGSILSNMLLVLGSAFLFGGLRYERLYFHKITSQINSTLLLISTMAIIFPTILLSTQQQSPAQELLLSRVCSVILFASYMALLYFQLFSHKTVYDNMGKESAVKMQRPGNSTKSNGSVGKAYQPISTNDGDSDEEVGNALIREKAIEMLKMGESQSQTENDETVATSLAPVAGDGETEQEDDDDEDDELEISYSSCILWLVIITLLIAVLSEAISDTIEKAAESAGISAIFISAIVLPIVGNAAEHAGAILFAMKGKMDLSLGVAMGSSTQIALCVLPFLVLMAWTCNLNLDLNFGAYEAMTLFLATLCVTFGIKDGVSTWMTGLVFIASYLIIAIGFLAHKNESLS